MLISAVTARKKKKWKLLLENWRRKKMMSEEYNLTKSKNNEECIMYKRTIKNEPNNIKID